MDGRCVQVFLCFEPDQRVCAEKIDAWPPTNSDLEAYDRRMGCPVDDHAAEAFKSILRSQIHAADVTICIIAGPTFLNPWIAWELEASKSAPKRNGLVGVLLKDFYEPPPAMTGSGAIFVPFKRDAIERAVAWALEEVRTTEDYTLQDE
jgi:hypothetical protein